MNAVDQRPSGRDRGGQREAAPAGSPSALAKWGFSELRRSAALVKAPELAGLVDPDDSAGVLRSFGGTADPDQGLAALVRFLEAAAQLPTDGPAGGDRLRAVLTRPGPARDRLLGVLGGSQALAGQLAKHPRQWVAAALPDGGPGEVSRDIHERTEAILSAVRAAGTQGHEAGEQAVGDRAVGDGAGGARAVGNGTVANGTGGAREQAACDALRLAYREQLLGIAAHDLTAPDPLAAMPAVAAALADLAAAALRGGLAIAGQQHPDAVSQCRIAVIGMGKCGGGELNYVSDVDVIFVTEPAPGVAESDALTAATQLATAMMRACSANTAEGTLWPVDAALRPEGKQGPLVRTVASHRQYYERWAKTWEFQALLKARVVAGDEEVGRAYLDAVQPMVWQACERDRFVEDVQAMRRRVEAHVPAAEAKRQLKLGAGGLRDVEFSVQLLQLVHGRTDEGLRSRTTLEALHALAAGGYVGRDAAAELDTSYRLFRCLEHRIQLYRMRRTHLMPTAAGDLRRLGRSMGYRADPEAEVVTQWQAHAREVRRLHERLFYRPLLAAAAKLSTDDIRLTPEAARARLAALGFADPAGAMRHLEALTAGYSRTAAMQRHLLPVMLGWFAQEADPDAGLLSFRRVSESLGSTHWYLKMLRDEGHAAEWMARVLARSWYAEELLEKGPESARLLGQPGGASPRDREAILATMRAAIRRREDPGEAWGAVASVRREELFRVAVADLAAGADLAAVSAALTDLTEATLECALQLAGARVDADRARRGEPSVAADLAIIGMGRLGGRECGYASDADVMFVYQPHPGADEQQAGTGALAVVQELIRMAGQGGPGPSLDIDADLRPEGKAGPLIRSLAAYRGYYERWSGSWEAQALLRARPVAGAAGLGQALMDLVAPVRYPPGGLAPAAVKEIRRLKARMESERLPRGADPRTHLKLGPGALSDVEWTIQLLQLHHAYAIPGLQTTQTLPALRVAVEAELIDEDDAQVLSRAWCLASSLRNAIMLWSGKPSDSLPKSLRDADGVYRIIGGEPGHGAALAEDYRKAARRARAVTERLFYGGALR